jgi:uracil-DNA glycosylase family 4
MYPSARAQRLETETACEPTPDCKKCTLHDGIKTVCMRPEGEPGGLLIVSDYPGLEEDKKGRPLTGNTGQFLRPLISKHWTGPIAADNAIKCAPGSTTVTAEHIDACRGYLANTLEEVNPVRVLAMGAVAIEGVLGRTLPPLSVRRGYAFLSNGVPVFLFPNPVIALRNRFERRNMEADIEWALKVPVEDLYRAPHDTAFVLVRTHVEAAEAVAAARRARWAAFDTETCGVMWSPGFFVHALAISLPPVGTCPGMTWVWDDTALGDKPLWAPLLQWLGDAEAPKVGQNAKFDIHAIECAFGQRVRGIVGDTRLWRKLLEPEADADLATMAELVGMGGHKTENEAALHAAGQAVRAARAAATKGQGNLLDLEPALELAVRHPDVRVEAFSYALVPPEVTARYVARDAATTAMLGDLLERRLAEPRSTPIRRAWDGVVCGATEAIARVEHWGIAVDSDSCKAYSALLALKLMDSAARLTEYKIRPSNNGDVARLLYKDLGLTPPHSTDKGAASVDHAALEALRGQHPVVSDILEWRRLAKLKSTYADAIPGHIRGDGRVHPDFLIDGSRAGRLSAKNPNMQQIPRPDPNVPESCMARDMFVAPKGSVLVQLDYGQIELRVAAMLSGDEDMRQIFLDGVDYHQRTAELISRAAWKIEPHEVTKAHRSAAKGFVFGLLYGMSDGTMAARMGITREEATKIRAAILGKFKGLARWSEEQVAYARTNGGTWTYWNGERARWRPLFDVDSKDEGRKRTALNGAINSPVQGSASDYCLASLIECVRWIEAEGFPAKLVLTVHDSLLFEVEERLAEELRDRARATMTGWPSGGVPLAVDAEIGRSWGSMLPFSQGSTIKGTVQVHKQAENEGAQA